ncbi:hypothetical protein DL96DRAFT_1614294 [Flagelloscypha sp. PMI_526]|nr:hypothetical protein DL96DRAFT_1614294 [Flagelloscypha sp. PMI_526]
MHFFAALSHTLAALISVSSAASIQRRGALSAAEPPLLPTRADISLRDTTPANLIYNGGFEKERRFYHFNDWKFPYGGCSGVETYDDSGPPAHSGTHYGFINSREQFNCGIIHPLKLERGVKYELKFYKWIFHPGQTGDHYCKVTAFFGRRDFPIDSALTGDQEYVQQSIVFTWDDSPDRPSDLLFEMDSNIECRWLVDDVSLTIISGPEN